MSTAPTDSRAGARAPRAARDGGVPDRGAPAGDGRARGAPVEGAHRAPRNGAAGFSLVEMLIGIVITGIVGASIVSVLIDQNVFYQENSRLVSAQKSLRGAADRMSTELRMVHRGDVLTAEADRLVTRYGVANGVVCHVSGGSAYLYLHRLPNAQQQPQDVRYLEPRFQGSWQSGLSWSDLSQDGSETCAGHGAPSGQPAGHYREVSSWPGGSPEVGTVLYATVDLTYRFGTQGDRFVLFRDGRRLVGPFEESPPYFRYFREDGGELSSPVTGGSLGQIAYVRIEATAIGHDPNARYEGDRTIDLRVPFRN